MRKRKVNYPVAKTATKGARNPLVPGDPRGNRTPATAIDMTALEGRNDLSVADGITPVTSAVTVASSPA